MKSRRSKATDIPQSVKEKVWERDNHRCIICGSPLAMPNAHFISRANGGLGHSEMRERTARKKEELKDISNGIDYAILDEFKRVLK